MSPLIKLILGKCIAADKPNVMFSLTALSQVFF